MPCGRLLQLCAWLAGLALAGSALAGEGTRRFEVPAGDAAETLKLAAQQGGLEIVYFAETVRGVRTPALRGHFAPREALERLVAGTGLALVADDPAGTLTVYRRETSTAASTPPTSPSPSPSNSPPFVKSRNPLLLLGAWLALAMTTGQSANAADSSLPTGTIEGRVFNAASGNALVNARVTLEGTAREVITDESGAYRFTGVPAGPARIAVSYLGLQPEAATVNVAAGGIVNREVELSLARAAEEVVKLAAFTVIADREMSAQALAMNEQRHAPNIKNVVAIDEFGDRGNENIGEFLLFLPGVAIATGGAEPTTVSLRGFPSNNSPITVDGADVAVSWGSNTRTSTLLGVPMTNISRVEVTKVPTPDMPASGLGGSINLVSRSGFESKKPKLAFNAYTIFHSHNGLTFDGGRRNHVKGTSPDYINPSFDFSYLGDMRRGAIAASATVPADVYEYQAQRTRIGLNAQYSLTKRYALYASVMDLGGFVQDLRRYGPTTPAYARGSRLQELGFNTYIGVRGSY